MPSNKRYPAIATAMAVLLCILPSHRVWSQTKAIDPQKLTRIGTVDERFQSYNIEMVEVIGGKFWKPYSQDVDALLKAQAAARDSGTGPVGMDPNLYQQRSPIDLANSRLRKLALGLTPAYVRVSGTWANTTYFQDSDAPSPATAPAGFSGLLTRPEWKGVVDFSKAVDAPIVTSVATGQGTRDANGVWTPSQARSFFAYTKSLGGKIAATEFMNEPTFAAMGGAPKGYDAATYASDLAVFEPFLRKISPSTILLGPGSVGEGGALSSAPIPGMLKSEHLLKAAGDIDDAFSYHFYGAVSMRCAALGAASQTSADVALSHKWLEQTNQVEAYYAGLRDKYAPGKPMWLTETADAACGGNPWGSTFTDSFRYLHQLGSLAKRGVKVVMHNTLAASDYGLIDEKTLAPRPNYWAAHLWSKFMGTGVLEAQPLPVENLYVYGQCLRNHPGSVALLILNTDGSTTQKLSIPLRAERFTLSAASLADKTVLLNGKPLSLNSKGDLPTLVAISEGKGLVSFAPQTITFLSFPEAHNTACK